MKDRLFQLVHWIGRSEQGIREDQAPAGGVVSDSVVTLSLRDAPDFQIRNDEDLPAFFRDHFIVHSMDGASGNELSAVEMFRVWMIFTLYMKKICFKDNDNPRGMILGAVVDFINDVFRKIIRSNLVDTLGEMFSCETCEACKDGSCPDSDCDIDIEPDDQATDYETDERYN